MTAGTRRPVAKYVIELPSGEKKHFTVPIVHDTGPGRLATLQIVRSCYPDAVTISSAEYVLQTDSRPDLESPLPSRENPVGEGRG